MIDPRKMKQLMSQMDMKEIRASEVIIKASEGDIVVRNPKVTKMNMMGQESYQILGRGEKQSAPKADETDVGMVREQTGASEEEARNALEKANGDIAAAILSLKH